MGANSGADQTILDRALPCHMPSLELKHVARGVGHLCTCLRRRLAQVNMLYIIDFFSFFCYFTNYPQPDISGTSSCSSNVCVYYKKIVIFPGKKKLHSDGKCLCVHYSSTWHSRKYYEPNLYCV
jgi:hypothetical protein